MRRTATSWPRAAASAVASARTCSSGERRRRSMPERTGPNRTPAVTRASTPTTASCSTPAPGRTDVQSNVAPPSEPGTHRSRGGTRRRSRGRTAAPPVRARTARRRSRAARGCENSASSATSVIVRPSSSAARSATIRPPVVRRSVSTLRAAGAVQVTGAPSSASEESTVTADARGRSTAWTPGKGRASAPAGGAAGIVSRPRGRTSQPRQRIAAEAPGPASRRSRRSPAIVRPSPALRSRLGPTKAVSVRGGVAESSAAVGRRKVSTRTPRRSERLGEPARAPGAGQKGGAPPVRVGQALPAEADQTSTDREREHEPRCRAPAQCAAACQGPVLVLRATAGSRRARTAARRRRSRRARAPARAGAPDRRSRAGPRAPLPRASGSVW